MNGSMHAHDWTMLATLLDDFGQLLDEEQRYLAQADIGGLEICHLRKSRRLNDIRSAVGQCRAGSSLAALMEEAPPELHARYRRITRGLQNNLHLAQQQRASLRVALKRGDRLPESVRRYASRLPWSEESAAVDVLL